MRLETQHERTLQSIADLTHVVERLTRVEERQQSLARIVYGAIGVLVAVEVGGVMYVLQQMAGV